MKIEKMKESSEIPYWKTHFTREEGEIVSSILINGQISQGPQISEFESRLASFLDVPYVVLTSSGSSSLLASLMVLNIGCNDEVIVPNRTWIATGHAPLLLGAKVKFADVEKDRPIIDVKSIENLITQKTKAIIPVHLGGRAADMRAINKLAGEYNIPIIEDAAQAYGSRNRDGLLGTQSLMGCFSLSVAKIISTGQGGFIATKSMAIYERLQKIKSHGVDSVINPVWDEPGFNFRLPGLLAGIGISQLKQMQHRMHRVAEIYKKYYAGISDLDYIKLIPVDLNLGELPVYVEALCIDRVEFIEYMHANGVQCRPFAPNLCDATYFKCENTSYVNSDIYAMHGIYLPAGPSQSDQDIDRVIKLMKLFKN
jgi:perosamine synthetase